MACFTFWTIKKTYLVTLSICCSLMKTRMPFCGEKTLYPFKFLFSFQCGIRCKISTSFKIGTSRESALAQRFDKCFTKKCFPPAKMSSSIKHDKRKKQGSM
jgi:hypothetical protein